jgi:hypothetical protein
MGWRGVVQIGIGIQIGIEGCGSSISIPIAIAIWLEHRRAEPRGKGKMVNPELTIAIDDFLVMRRAPLDENGRAAVAERARVNAEFLDAISVPPAGGALSGTFVYAHPPDYRGRPTLDWDAGRWRALFQELKALGIRLAILQAAAWLDFEECYYPSDLFRGFRTWNVVEPLLEGAAAEGMTVFLGAAGVLYNETEFGVPAGDPAPAVAAARREIRCYRELLDRYRGHFHGYYLAPETGFPPDQNPSHLRCFHAYFERVTNEVKALTPELPVLGSPWTAACPGQEEAAVEYLSRLHANCPFTALAPQDSIGTFSNLAFLERGLGIWKRVCAAIGAEFWSNCESFAITDPGGPVVTIEPAEFRRFAVQLDTAARAGARRMITWEAPYFLAAEGCPAARRLRAEYLAQRPPPREVP